MNCVYKNNLSELAQLASDIETFAARHHVSPESAHAFNLCLDELFTNIVSYGFTDDKEHLIHLDFQLHPHEITAILRDDAKAFNPLTEAPIPDLHADIEDRKIGGLGVHFVKTLMSRVEYRREGNQNVLEMARPREHPAPAG